LLQHRASALQAEIDERKEAERQLRISETMYRRLFESSNDGILIIDWRTRQVSDANPSAMELLGLSLEELIDKDLSEIGLFDRESELDEMLRELEDKQTVRTEHISLKSGGAENRNLEMIGSRYIVDGHSVLQLNLRDVTMRERVAEIGSHLAAIVESSEDAIISKTLEGVILTWNAGASRVFGYDASEVIGKSIYILIPIEKYDEEAEILKKLKRGERIEHYETVRVAKDGRRLDISLTVSPVRDKTGKIVAGSKIARDITDKKRAESERAELLEREKSALIEAKRANRVKDEFLAMLSHELRTPLNAILGWTRILRTGSIGEADRSRALETIERNAKSQARLIEDLLDVSRIIAGKLRLDVTPVDLTKVIADAIDVVRPAANAKGISVRVELDSRACCVSGDSARLQQTMGNLLSNAVKFTPNNGSVQISLQRKGDDVEISIADTGRGIDPEFLPFVFESFRQADSSLTRKHGGLGLGLAIARQLVEMHGGTVAAYSEGTGRGSTFVLRFPIIKTSEHVEPDRDSARG